ncbi:TAXI family TRAP transporter solute-binding subunit [Jiella sonneratiae]|uniref:TAXI family TRAP transporter solute-binding subunit n=1 Tax=Jiella sonneratiae TaxID=2816856 RepID=A0ABS3J5A3_9HYPH|nr:TAXI family TRAP transporter solute-binding subunit [Jiella sonneratiae]MBO0903746.1 TAXI family TRAP transporter solute-binding subunit [Jiella sonneratiae]
MTPALFGAALIAAGSSAWAQDAAVNLTVASFQQGSSWYVYAVNLSELLQKKLPAGSTVDAPPIAGGIGNPALVSKGRADLAFGMAVVGSWALEGKYAYDAPLDNLRALVGGWDQYYLVPMARGAEVSGKLDDYFESHPEANVTLLRRGSIGSFGGEQLLDIAGEGEDRLSSSGGSYEFGSFDMVKSRFASGSGDVFIQVGTRGHPGITEIAQTTPSTFLQPSQDELDAMRDSYGWQVATLPSGTFPGQDSDLDLPGTTTTLFASTEMSDDLAYEIVKTICESADTLKQAHKALSNFSCENGAWKMENNGLPLHAGAERYYREKGWLN